MDPAEVSVGDRLLRGARILGALWRSGQRCPGGWGKSCSGLKTQFCIGKEQWLALAFLDRGGPAWSSESPFMILELMKASELEATGLTIMSDNGVKVGPKGEVQVRDAAKMEENPSAVPAVLRILKAFPGARIVKTA